MFKKGFFIWIKSKWRKHFGLQASPSSLFFFICLQFYYDTKHLGHICIDDFDFTKEFDEVTMKFVNDPLQFSPSFLFVYFFHFDC